MLKVLVVTALAFAALPVAAVAASATTLPKVETTATEVIKVGRRGHFRGFHGGHHRFRRFHGGHHRFHRFHGARIIIGAPVYTYGVYGGGCRWLRHRALVTGSPYSFTLPDERDGGASSSPTACVFRGPLAFIGFARRAALCSLVADPKGYGLIQKATRARGFVA
jgi:hypothetical protein